MVEIVEYIAKEWTVIKGAPFVIVTLLAFAATGGFLIARYRYGTLAEVAHERRQLSAEQSTRLAAELQELKSRASSNAGIEELRQRIDSLPKIFTGPNPPPGPVRDGDIWLQTD